MLKRSLAFIGVAAALTAILYYNQAQTEPFKVSGLIEADEIRLGSRVGGRVARVHAQEGQTVEKGDELVELEAYDLKERQAEAQAQWEIRRAKLSRLEAGFRPEEVAQAKARRDRIEAELEKLINGPRPQEIAAAEAEVRQAEAELELSHQDFERTQSLFERKVSAQGSLDQANEKLKSAQAHLRVTRERLAVLQEGSRSEDVAGAQARLDEADQAWQMTVKGYRKEEIEEARAGARAAEAMARTIERQIEELTIKAPLGGVIEAIDLQPGDLVSANAPVISIMDAGNLWVRAYVPENQLNIQTGQPVEVSVDSYPGERFQAHVSFISRQAEFLPGNVQTPEDRSKQVFRIKVTLDEGLDRLRPGMSADVWFEPQKAGP